jgi:hypothetical protein
MGQGGQPLRDLDQALLGVHAAAPETAKLLSTMPERRSRKSWSARKMDTGGIEPPDAAD